VTKSRDAQSPVQLLSVEELAGMLQVPAKTVYQWRYLGEGPPSVRIGRYLRFDPRDVVSWLEDRKAMTAMTRRAG
jgi:predicted DNA-binding transcriptional regulator AlpA